MVFRGILLLLALALGACNSSGNHSIIGGGSSGGASTDQLRRDGRYMVDAQNRVVLLHGFNAVWKLPPYYPPNTAAGFTAADADWLRDHGFNSVRLGTLFVGVMPEQGVIDQDYLRNVDRVVQLLASRGIYVMFDFHQDLYNEKYTGEGFPDWAVYDDGIPPTNAGFPGTYFTPATTHTFDNFWLNHENIWDWYRDAWKAVAVKWRNQDHHGGYDLFNEPYPGSQFATCANPLGCPLFDVLFLRAMQDHVRTGIREVDANNIVFYEPNFVFNGGAITHLGTTGAIPDANVGLSWHKYCLLGVVLHSQGFTDLPLCPQLHQLVSDNAERAIAQMGATTLVTEFGASDDLADIQQVMDQTDAQFTGWQYWAYKEWGDPTTESQESGGQGMFAKDEDLGTVKVEKLKLLERPYPQATAGIPVALSFDAASTTMQYRYQIMEEGPRSPKGPTVIYVPKLHYPNGYNVAVTGAKVTSAANATRLVLQNLAGAGAVEVSITPP